VRRVDRSVVDKADREDLPVYLETGNPRNVPLYQKFGFATVYTEKAGLMGPTVYYMRRYRLRLHRHSLCRVSRAWGLTRQQRCGAHREAKSVDDQTKEQLLAKAKKRVADSNQSLKRGLLAVGVVAFVALLLLLFYIYVF
jgi:hypothetical protein